MASSVLPFCLALILLSANLANCLTCYNCNSKDSKRCDWGIVSFTYPTEECSSSIIDALVSPKCYKITAENKDGSTYIARGCTPSGTVTGACSALAKTIGWVSSETDGEGLRNLSCETCETDKCNSATKITTISVGVLILSAIMFLL